jgi:RNA polymerase sigma factor (sigma-70 family)
MFGLLGVYEVQMASDYSVELPLPLAPRAGEAELVARAVKGDHQAYATLVRPHERVAYRVAAAITGWNADAEEATQNGFVKAYRSLHRFRPGAAFRPWLLRIVVNEAHNVLRAERRHERLGARAAEKHDAAVAGADEAVVAREEVETVLSALARLSDADRLAVALRYFAELPDGEAAALAGTSREAYRVRLLRARRRLRKLLEEADD